MCLLSCLKKMQNSGLQGSLLTLWKCNPINVSVEFVERNRCQIKINKYLNDRFQVVYFFTKVNRSIRYNHIC